MEEALGHAHTHTHRASRERGSPSERESERVCGCGAMLISTRITWNHMVMARPQPYISPVQFVFRPTAVPSYSLYFFCELASSLTLSLVRSLATNIYIFELCNLPRRGESGLFCARDKAGWMRWGTPQIIRLVQFMVADYNFFLRQPLFNQRILNIYETFGNARQ